MTIEDRLEDLRRDLYRLKEVADDNNYMLKAICETLSVEKERTYGVYSGPEVPLREQVDSLLASLSDKEPT